VSLPSPPRPVGSPLCSCSCSPTCAALPHLLTVRSGRPQMPSWAKVLGHRAIRGQQTPGMARRLQPLHAIRTLARGPMRVFTAVLEVAALAMLHPGQALPLGRAVTTPQPAHAHDDGHRLNTEATRSVSNMEAQRAKRRYLAWRYAAGDPRDRRKCPYWALGPSPTQPHMNEPTRHTYSEQGPSRRLSHQPRRPWIGGCGRVERLPPVFRSALCSPLLSPFGLESVTVFDPAPLCASCPSRKPTLHRITW
jgi:hypothetical protein